MNIFLMNTNKKNFIILFIKIFVLILFLSLDIHSQSQFDSNNFNVKWIETINSLDNFSENKSFFAKIGDFIFGSQKISFIKPVNLLSFNQNKILILDQGIQYPIILDLKEKEMSLIKSDSLFPSMIGICKINNNFLFTD